MTNTENFGPPGAESWLTIVKDIVLGGAAGALLAIAWVVLAALAGSDAGSFGGSIKGCGLLLLLLAWVAAGALVGLMIGEGVGAAIGGIACYLLPFIVYGAHVQRTIGWKAWLRGDAGDRNAKEMNWPKE